MSFAEALRKHAEDRKAKYMEHVRQEYQELYNAGQPIPIEVWKQLRMNSYEREILVPLLTDDAFVWMIETHFKSGGMEELSEFSTPPVTYSVAVEKRLIFQLLRRFQNKLKEG